MKGDGLMKARVSIGISHVCTGSQIRLQVLGLHVCVLITCVTYSDNQKIACCTVHSTLFLLRGIILHVNL